MTSPDSAENVAKSIQNDPTYQHVMLKQAFKFDDDDLAINRDGNLSQRQMQRFDALRQRQRQWGIVGLCLAALWGCMLLISSHTAIIASKLGAFLIWLLILSSVGGIYFLYRSLTSILDTEPGVVGSVQGVIELVSGRLKIGNLTFDLKPGQRTAFRNYEPYSIYYLPQSGIILSAERLFEILFEAASPPDPETVNNNFDEVGLTDDESP